jgi:hypothetical protein
MTDLMLRIERKPTSGSADTEGVRQYLRLSAAVALVFLAITPSQAASSCPVTPSLVAGEIPDEVCRREFDHFANMAWQTFKMLVWPASSRGMPDGSRAITDMAGPRVFQTYKSDWETFLANGAQPLAWDQYPDRAPVCRNAATMPPLAHDALVLSSLTKFGNITERDIKADPGNAAVAQLLIAQNGSPARYLVSFDEKAFNHIRTNRLYGPIAPPSGDAPIKDKTQADFGTITIKSSWIEIRNSHPDPRKFFTVDAWLQDPGTGECKPAKVALVGFHFAHKTKLSPQWNWSSFEHVDNAPLRKIDNPPPYDPPPVDGYTFNDDSGRPMDPEPPASARMRYPWVAAAPYNVERWKPIAETNRHANDAWRKLLRDAGSVWSNYQLVAVEWPLVGDEPARTGLGVDIRDSKGIERIGARPAPPCVIDEKSNVANTVIETFVQRHVHCRQRTTCMSCHNSARNYDFIWSIPLKDNDAPAADLPSAVRRSALTTLRAITGYGSRQ